MKSSAELAAAIKAQVDCLHQRFIPARDHRLPSLLAFLRRALESVGSEDNRQAHLFLNEYAATALEALEELEDFAAARRKPSLGTPTLPAWPPWCAPISAAAPSASRVRRCRECR